MVDKLRPRKAVLPKLAVPTTSDAVYTSRRWKRLARILRARNPVCQRCGQDLATEVHHLVPIEQAPALAFDASNLISVCKACHQAEHAS